MTGVVLDDAATLHAADPGDMLRAVASSASQVREGAHLAAEAGVSRLVEDGRPRAVLVVGAGATGDVLLAVAGPASPAPVLSVAGPPLPAWVGAADLVVVTASSGSDPDALAALEEAARRGARLLVVGPADSPLEDLAVRGRGVFVPVRGDRPTRAALWSLAAPVLVAAHALGLAPADPEAVEAAAAALERVAERCRPDADAVGNPAKALAQELVGTLPVLWGTTALTGAAARRAAAQLAAGAGAPALAGVLPALLEDQVAVLGGPWAAGVIDDDDFFRDRVEDVEDRALTPLHLVLLRDTDELPRAAARASALIDLAPERGCAVSSLVPQPGPALARLAELVATTDFAAVYLALLTGVDPTPLTGQLQHRTR